MRTLLARGLVEEAGQDGETGANLYRTTNYFLERIGITALTDLPELAPFLPDMEDMEDDLAELAGAGQAQPAVPEEPNPEQNAEPNTGPRSEEHTSELQSLMRISYAVFCWKKKKELISIDTSE